MLNPEAAAADPLHHALGGAEEVCSARSLHTCMHALVVLFRISKFSVPSCDLRTIIDDTLIRYILSASLLPPPAFASLLSSLSQFTTVIARDTHSNLAAPSGRCARPATRDCTQGRRRAVQQAPGHRQQGGRREAREAAHRRGRRGTRSRPSSPPPPCCSGPECCAQNEEEELGSDLDESEEQVPETDNLVLCQYEKVTRHKTKTGNRFKCVLKDGIMSLGGREILFHKGSGDAED